MHRPKDKDIRDLCAVAGVTWPEPTPRTRNQEATDDESFWDENGESEGSEEETDDEEVEIEEKNEEGWIDY